MIIGQIKASDFVEGKDLQDACFEFLDALRESGVTNMFGAVPYLEEEFDLEYRDAKEILKKWMATFAERMARGEVKA